MFETESKEYANKWLEHFKELELQHKSDDKPEYIRILEAHQKGAEFGYNKANEWHYVKDGDLPKHENYVLVSNGKDWTKGFYKDKQWSVIHLIGIIQIIMWKEIVLPEVKEGE